MCFSKLSSTSNELLETYGGLHKHNLNTALEHFWKDEEPEESFPTSHYFDIDSIIFHMADCKNDFSLLSLNIESLNAKFDKFCAFLRILSDKGLFF